MIEIADYMRAEAGKHHPEALRHQIARTAFNRYYYAVFLKTRLLLVKINRWITEKGKTPRHSELPRLLRQTLKKEILRRCGLIDAPRSLVTKELTRIAKDAEIALKAQASILEKMNKVREVADYEPETSIGFVGLTPTLSGETLSSMHTMYVKTNTWLGTIERTFRSVGLT